MQANSIICSGTSRFLNDIYTKGIKSTNFQYDADTPSVTVGTRSSGTVGSYSFTAGYNNVASGDYSHAEGLDTSASGDWGAHAEGCQTIASGTGAHAEGSSTTASGITSHAEGNHTEASGSGAHAEGNNTVARRKDQHVFGEFNILDTQGSNNTVRGKYVEIVGNGNADNDRSDARRLSWTGDEWLAGSLTTTDVTKGSGTWDGTNTSLATALSNKLSLSGGTITGAITSTQTATQSVMIPATADGGMFGTFDYPYRAFWATRLCASTQQNNRYLKMTGTDITFASTVSGDTTNTWDGINASLKDAITAIYSSTLCYSASISRGSGWTQKSTSTAFPSSTTGTYLFMIKDSNGTIYSRIPVPAADFARTTSTRPLIVRSNGTSSDANNIMTYWSSTTKFYTYAGSSSMPTGTFTLVIHYTPLNI